ncbi:MAG: type II secretion system F family protein [Henriciella sp.]
MTVLLAIIIFATVFLITLGIGLLISFKDPVTSRIGTAMEVEKRQDGLRLQKENARLDHFLRPFKQQLQKSSGSDESKLDSVSLLKSAGFYNPRAAPIFLAIRMTLAIVFSVAAATVLVMTATNLSPLFSTFAVVMVGAVGYYGPAIVVTQIARDKKEQFSRGLPDALDMTLICLEAGQSFPVALKFVAKEFGSVHPEISRQFEIVNLEFRAGRDRSHALKNLARRVDLSELTSIVNMVNQSEALGTSLTSAIRAAAFDMRRARLLRAEERANKLPVLMSVPLTTCIFPTLFMIILVPVLLNIMENIPG